MLGEVHPVDHERHQVEIVQRGGGQLGQRGVRGLLVGLVALPASCAANLELLGRCGEGCEFARAPRLNERVYDVTDVLEPIARDKGCSMAALSLAWVLRQPGVTSPIMGPEGLGDLEDGLTALDVAINDDGLAAIDAVAPPTHMLSPFYEPDADQFRPHHFRTAAG